jgi:folate-dependent phosphoribosylglycinamide formyltransferase PurN
MSPEEAKSQQYSEELDSTASAVGQERLRVIVLTHGGAEDVLRGLVALKEIELVGVFVETEIVRQRGVLETLKRSLRYDGYAATISKALRKLTSRKSDDVLSEVIESRDELRRIAEAHQIPFHLVENYHRDDSIELMSSSHSDLGVIYGTNIVKESVFKIPRLGSINLHQGLAPFYRGGPPVFWELYNEEAEVGLTVHFVETKVDSGAIILQEQVPLTYEARYGTNYEAFIEDFSEGLRQRSAHLVVEAVRRIAQGTANPQPQDPTLGKRYRLPLKAEKDELRRRLRKRHKASPESAFQVDAGRSDEASNA